MLRIVQVLCLGLSLRRVGQPELRGSKPSGLVLVSKLEQGCYTLLLACRSESHLQASIPWELYPVFNLAPNK